MFKSDLAHTNSKLNPWLVGFFAGAYPMLFYAAITTVWSIHGVIFGFLSDFPDFTYARSQSHRRSDSAVFRSTLAEFFG